MLLTGVQKQRVPGMSSGMHRGMRTGRGLFDPMLLLLLFTSVVHAQLPFHPKFLAAGPDDSPFLEAQRDALNLHDGGDDASVALVAPIAINCTALGTDFKAVLLQKGAHPAMHRQLECIILVRIAFSPNSRDLNHELWLECSGHWGEGDSNQNDAL